MKQPTCGQCGRPAVCSINNVNLCVDCYSRFQAANNAQLRHAMTMLNYLMDEMDFVSGLGGLSRSPRIKLPPPSPILANQGPMNFHNINVQGSVVGAINTGEVQRIDVAIDQIRFAGDPALAQSLAHFTEALLASTELQLRNKTEILEQLSFLTTQTFTPKDQRKPGIIRSVLDGVTKAINTSTALITLWDKLHPLLSKALS